MKVVVKERRVRKATRKIESLEGNSFYNKKSYKHQKKKLKFWTRRKEIKDKPEPVLCFHTG